MNFIKENWSRFSMALLYLLGGALGIIMFISYGFADIFEAKNFADAFLILVPVLSFLVYFFGMVALLITKCVASKKVSSILYMAIGGFIALLNLVTFVVFSSELNLAGAVDFNTLFVYVVPMIVFGFYPLLKGITRFIEAEVVAVKAKAPAKKEVAAK